MTETELQKTILEFLDYQPGKYWRQNTGRMGGVNFGFKGLSDIIGIHPDFGFVAIECKIKGNKPTKEQQTFLETINYHGGLGIVAYSLDDVINSFKINGKK